METKPYLDSLKTCLQACACDPYNFYGDQTLALFTYAISNLMTNDF